MLPVHTVPLVSVWCWYHVGSKDEAPGTTGASHWVEHMNFKGTRNISRGGAQDLGRACGRFLERLHLDRQTTYFETLAADSLDLALKIEAERMTECLYDADEFESERTVIISELQGNENNPAYLLDVEVTAGRLSCPSYGWPTSGWQSDLETMSREDLVAPLPPTLCALQRDPGHRWRRGAGVGTRAAGARFGPIDSGEPPRRVMTREPDQEGERRVAVERPGTTRYLQVSYHARLSPTRIRAAVVADAVLSGGKGISLWPAAMAATPEPTSPLYGALVERSWSAS